MAKFTLEIEENFDFQLIGIFSHAKDYRLCWALNQEFGFDLTKEENFTVQLNSVVQEHSFFKYFEEENQLEYFLIGNRSDAGMLIPEEKCDYFFLIKGHYRDSERDSLKKKLNQLKPILACSIIEVDELKSKQNLIF